MRYMLMANPDGSIVTGLSLAAQKELNQRYIDFTTVLVQSGVLRGAEQLHPADTATTVRVREGSTLLTDGPFAELPEAFGGFWVVEAPDLDTALAHAER